MIILLNQEQERYDRSLLGVVFTPKTFKDYIMLAKLLWHLRMKEAR